MPVESLPLGRDLPERVAIVIGVVHGRQSLVVDNISVVLLINHDVRHVLVSYIALGLSTEWVTIVDGWERSAVESRRYLELALGQRAQERA